MISKVSFRANMLTPVSLKKKNAEGVYEDLTAHCVEFTPESQADKLALKRIAGKWGGQKSMASDVSKSFDNQFYGLTPDRQERFFGITSQSDNFECMDSEKILGVVLLEKLNRKDYKIDFIQTHPKTIWTEETKDIRPYIGVGSSLLNSLRAILPYKNFTGKSLEKSVQFFKKLGYTVTENSNEILQKGLSKKL